MQVTGDLLSTCKSGLVERLQVGSKSQNLGLSGHGCLSAALPPSEGVDGQVQCLSWAFKTSGCGTLDHIFEMHQTAFEWPS